MDRQTLVEADLAAGRQLVLDLDHASFPVAAAFWLHDSEPNAWKLVIATKEAERDIHKAYVAIGEILRKKPEDFARIDLSDVRLVKPKDPIVLKLSRQVPVRGIGEARWNYGAIDGTVIEDAIIYRTAA